MRHTLPRRHHSRTARLQRPIKMPGGKRPIIEIRGHKRRERVSEERIWERQFLGAHNLRFDIGPFDALDHVGVCVCAVGGERGVSGEDSGCYGAGAAAVVVDHGIGGERWEEGSQDVQCYVLGGGADSFGEDGCCFWRSLFGRERGWCVWTSLKLGIGEERGHAEELRRKLREASVDIDT